MEQLKNIVNKQSIAETGNLIKNQYPQLDLQQFIETSSINLDVNGLNDRGKQVSIAIIEQLKNEPFAVACKILQDAVEQDQVSRQKINSFFYQPFADFAASEFSSKSDIAPAFDLLLAVTKKFTAEFAIRPFIEQYPKETFEYLRKWTKDENEHVRRLVSEGTRPRLPWASQIKEHIKNPNKCLPLLAELFHDPSEYVRRSVANHLNDIAKDHPEVLLDFLQAYKKDTDKNSKWIIKHALRTLIKDGNLQALSLVGIEEPRDIFVNNFQITKQLQLGSILNFSFELENKSRFDQSVLIDFIIHHVKANGNLAPKVFKLKQCELASKGKETISKNHPMRPISTRKYYNGTHLIEIQINGQVLYSAKFELSVL